LTTTGQKATYLTTQGRNAEHKPHTCPPTSTPFDTWTTYVTGVTDNKASYTILQFSSQNIRFAEIKRKVGGEILLRKKKELLNRTSPELKGKAFGS